LGSYRISFLVVAGEVEVDGPFAVAVASMAGLVFAGILGDATGSGTGKFGSLERVTFAAGPAPDGDGLLMPGQDGDAVITATNNSASPQYLVAFERRERRLGPRGRHRA
jgi:hypothetical protein